MSSTITVTQRATGSKIVTAAEQPSRPKLSQLPSSAPEKSDRFMRATWHLQGKSMLDFAKNWALDKALLLDLMVGGNDNVPKPTGKVPVISAFSQHCFVLPLTLPPIILQYISMVHFNYSWSPLLAYAVYFIWEAIYAKLVVARLNKLVLKYGYLDNGNSRDHAPDARTLSTAMSIIAPLSLRPLLGVLTAYKQDVVPSLPLLFPVRAFLHVVALDFVFYVYHRSMHEIPFLWKFHKTHHMAKHPTVALSGFADIEQEFIEFVLVPLLTSVIYPLSFHEWWIVSLYILNTEATGHSGLRAYVPTPITSPVMRVFGMDLEIEDHDLHHRTGWRKSYNYGKQTKIFDKLMGTTRPRIECADDNVDW